MSVIIGVICCNRSTMSCCLAETVYVLIFEARNKAVLYFDGTQRA